MSINEKGEIDFVVALLIFGKLGESAKISLKSIGNLGTKKICILADKAGENWIKKYQIEFNLPALCFHEPNAVDLLSMNLNLNKENNYSEFGSERFIKLTTFKWFLIMDTLKSHKEIEGTLFTDLDVLWRKLPENQINDGNIGKNFALIQDDSPLRSTPVHFCTGIMYWKNIEESKKNLLELFNIQKRNIESEKLIPDEPTFNKWYQTMQNSEGIKAFSKTDIVIGHRFFNLCTNRNNFDYENFSAFHSNYVIGENRKSLMLKTLLFRINGNYIWVFGLLRYLNWKVCLKIKSAI